MSAIDLLRAAVREGRYEIDRIDPRGATAWEAGYAQGYMEGEAAAERRNAAEITPDDRWDLLAMIASYALVALIAVLILWPEPVWRVLGVSP